jgi:hypothetical protein
VIIAVCIPAVCLLGAANIVYRMPDLYVYEFNKNQISDEIGLNMKDDELGQFFSDFMSGKKDDFDLFAEYRDREQSVFSTVEQINMENARNLLNRALYILAGAFALAAAGIAAYLAKKKKYELRIAFKGGIAVYTAVTVLSLITLSFEQVKTLLCRMIFVNAFGADDVLPQMLTREYAQYSVLAILAVSMILLILLASAVWRLTKPRRMFW